MTLYDLITCMFKLHSVHAVTKIHGTYLKEICSVSRQSFHLRLPQVTRNAVYLKAASKTGPSTKVTSIRCFSQRGLGNKLAVWLHLPKLHAEFTDCSKGLKNTSLTPVGK